MATTDIPGGSDEIEGLNDVARLCRTLSLTFLFAALVIIAMAVSADDETLLRETPLSLPPFNLPVSVVGFFATAPWVIVVLHAHLLLKLKVLYERMAAIKPNRLQDQKNRLFPYEILLYETRENSPYRTLLRVWLTATHLALPILALLYLQLEFLDYQSEFITLTQRLALLAELSVLYFLLKGYTWPFGAGDTAPRKLGVLAALPIAGFAWTLGAAVTGSAAAAAGIAAVATTAFAVAVPIRPRFAAAAATLMILSGLASVHGGRMDKAVTSFTADWMEPTELEGSDGIARHWRDARVLDLSGKTLLPETVTPQVLAKLIEDPDFAADWSAESLGLDLRGRTLRGAIFDDANLIAARLSDRENITDLTSASFRRAFLRHATLASAAMNGADLSRATLTGANLQKASMSNTELFGAKMDAADLSSAIMINANLVRTSFRGANLEGANMIGVGLVYAELLGARLPRAKLIAAHIFGTDASGADLTSASIDGASIRHSKLHGANLTDASMTGTYLSNVDLSHAVVAALDFPRREEIREEVRPLLGLIAENSRWSGAVRRIEIGLNSAVGTLVSDWDHISADNTFTVPPAPWGGRLSTSLEDTDLDKHAMGYANALVEAVCGSRAAMERMFNAQENSHLDKRRKSAMMAHLHSYIENPTPTILFQVQRIDHARRKALAIVILETPQCPALDLEMQGTVGVIAWGPDP